MNDKAWARRQGLRQERVLTERKFTIGEVSLTRAGMGWPKEPLGDERVSILRAFYRGQELHGWIPVVTNPLRKLTKDQVNWDTAGEAITGD